MISIKINISVIVIRVIFSIALFHKCFNFTEDHICLLPTIVAILYSSDAALGCHLTDETFPYDIHTTTSELLEICSHFTVLIRLRHI